MADKRYYVWCATSTEEFSPQIWSSNPEDRGPDNKEYGPKIAAYHEIPPELYEVADAERGLFLLAEHFPPPREP